MIALFEWLFPSLRAARECDRETIVYLMYEVDRHRRLIEILSEEIRTRVDVHEADTTPISRYEVDMQLELQSLNKSTPVLVHE